MQIRVTETGRSMVEILGVLAVIGVLSVGGIMGYKFAMDKYRTNDIVESVHMRSTDIWHIYHDTKKTLPETEPGVDAFPEYGETTKTGFPIMITSHLDVAFKIWVDDVPNNICKQVLGQDLNKYVKGLKYIQVNGVRYEGDVNICPKDEVAQMVFTSFINTDGSTREEGDSQRCAENEDCDSCCGISKCDTKSMTCVDECTSKDQVCNQESCTCVECVKDSDCMKGQVCDVSRQQCVSIPEECGEGENFGKEYRAANGTCISCSYKGEVIVMNSDNNDGIYETQVGDKVIKDTHTGQEMCLACNTLEHRVEEAGSGDNLKTYCATGCVMGNSFLSKSGGCVKCDSTSEPALPNDEQARRQCAACSNRVWFYRGWGDYYCVLKDCPDGYVKYDGFCYPCKLPSGLGWWIYYDYYSARIWISSFKTSDGNLTSLWSEGCNKCTTVADDTLRDNRHIIVYGSSTYCPHKCASGQFQSMYGTCYDCSEETSPSMRLNERISGYLKNLCTTACTNREVQDNKCVKILNETCDEETQFKGTDGKCYACDYETRVLVESDEASGCTQNCNRAYDKNNKYCYPTCGTGYIQDFSGACVACSDIGNGYNMGYHANKSDVILNVCTTGCGIKMYEYSKCSNTDYYCCRPIDCGSGKIHSGGTCTACPTSGTSKSAISQTECEACGNHIYLDGYCVYYKPGTSGVCNNDGVGEFPDYSPVGVYYRDNTGICRRCDSQTTAYKATAEECASCNGLRRLTSDGQCVHDGCTENITFLTLTGCMACDTSELKVQVPNNNEAKMMCESCSRRIMTVNANSTEVNAYCVAECDSDEWQDVDGSCHIKEIDTQTNEIGSDEESQSLCRKSGRTVYQEGFKFYCEQEAE